MSEITGADFTAAAADLSAGTTSPEAVPSSPDFSDGSDASTDPSPRATDAEQQDQPQDDTPRPAVKPRGPIPFERHQSILQNTRETARRDTIQQVRSQYGPQLQVGHAFLNDPVGFVQAVMQHPAYAQQFRSQAPPPDERESRDLEPELVTDTGVPAYSARQVQRMLQQTAKQVQDAIDGRLSPIEQRFQGADIDARATSAATTIIRDLSETYGGDWPKMQRDVANLMAQDRRLKPETAAMRVWRQKIQPTIRATERSAVVDGLRRKASASTERPNRPSSGTPRRDSDKSWTELFAEEFNRAAR